MRTATVLPLAKKPTQDTTVWLAIASLTTDPAVNRPISQSHVDRIAAEFDPDFIGIIHVSIRDGDQRVVIDGQHRVAACRQLGWLDQKIECKTYRGLTVAQEAALFVHLNDFRRPTPIQRFLKRVTAGEADAVTIDEIVRGIGLRIDAATVDGNIGCVTALERIYRGDKFNVKSRQPIVLRKTLLLARDSWGLVSEAFQGDIVLGLGMVLLRYGNKVDLDHLRSKLAPIDGGPLGVLGRARTLRSFKGGSVAQNLAEVVVDLYNKGMKVNKLPGWRGQEEP